MESTDNNNIKRENDDRSGNVNTPLTLQCDTLLNQSYSLANFVTLNVSSSKLTILPKYLTGLTSLKSIDISDNTFYYLPHQMKTMKSLREIRASHNYLILLPQYLDNLPALELLDVYDNYISDKFCKLEHVLYFDMASNRMEEPNTETYAKQKTDFRVKFNLFSRIDNRRDIDSETRHDSSSNYSMSDQTSSEDHPDDDWSPDETNCRKTDSWTEFYSCADYQSCLEYPHTADLHVKSVPDYASDCSTESGQFDD